MLRWDPKFDFDYFFICNISFILRHLMLKLTLIKVRQKLYLFDKWMWIYLSTMIKNVIFQRKYTIKINKKSKLASIWLRRLCKKVWIEKKFKLNKNQRSHYLKLNQSKSKTIMIKNKYQVKRENMWKELKIQK